MVKGKRLRANGEHQKKRVTFYLLPFAFCLFFLFVFAVTAYSFSAGGCDGDCRKCHTLTNEEALGILKKMHSNAKVAGIQISPVKGLWEVTLDDNGKKGIFYTDFSKKFVISGPIIEVSSGTNKTQENFQKLQNNRKIDVSRIPLNKALVIGKRSAPKKVIVFTDPECPFCAKLHQEMKKVVAERKDIVFYIKLFPLAAHKDSYWKATSMSCKKSLKMMDDNFEGRPIAKAECSTKEIDENIKLAESLGITGTPTLILPGGKVHEGTLPADKLIDLIDKKAVTH
ncbi:MAG: DsbC family protein [Nitrospirae bacterium]|nr:DsbC family protein [Nitrospirota bacterium]